MTASNLFTQLAALTSHKVFFGPQGFDLANSEQKQQSEQAKFVKQSASVEQVVWPENWCVIGRDTELGDPYFVDTDTAELSVFTAMLAEDGWQSFKVAESLTGFVTCLNLLAQASKQTKPEFVPSKTTCSDEDKLEVLQDKLVAASVCQAFWGDFFACYLDWLDDVE